MHKRCTRCARDVHEMCTRCAREVHERGTGGTLMGTKVETVFFILAHLGHGWGPKVHKRCTRGAREVHERGTRGALLNLPTTNDSA